MTVCGAAVEATALSSACSRGANCRLRFELCIADDNDDAVSVSVFCVPRNRKCGLWWLCSVVNQPTNQPVNQQAASASSQPQRYVIPGIFPFIVVVVSCPVCPSFCPFVPLMITTLAPHSLFAIQLWPFPCCLKSLHYTDS